jgi:DNA polymerase
MGRGAVDAALMLIGEQPGDQEDQQGEPFVGPAGRLLDRALAQAGVDTESQRLHRSPTRTHVAACGPWLVAELELVKPQGVVLLGASAGKAVYGPDFRVGDARGEPAHPAAVLRSRQRDEDFDALVADLRTARDLLVR